MTTPDETIRLAATQCPDGVPVEDFDRWLAAHDAEVRAQVAGELHYEAKAMTRFNAHPAMADAGATATAYREGIRDGLTAAAHIARQEQP